MIFNSDVCGFFQDVYSPKVILGINQIQPDFDPLKGIFLVFSGTYFLSRVNFFRPCSLGRGYL